MTLGFDSIVRSLKNHGYHCVLCGLFFLLYNVNELKGFVAFSDMVAPFFILLLLPLLFKLVLAKFTRKAIPSGIFTTFFFLFVLFYANSFFFLISFKAIKSFLKEGYFILIVLSVLFSIAIVLFRARRSFGTLNLYLNILLIAYFTIELAKFARTVSHTDRAMGTSLVESDEIRKRVQKTAPNVYLIITDAYANEKNLLKYWGYDNREFISFLKKSGFYYCEDSKSNYNNTGSSMASMLNMEFLPASLDVNNAKDPIEVQNLLVQKIKTNVVFQTLYAEGYSVHNVSIFDILNFKPFYFDRFLYPNFYNHLLSKTLPMRIFYRYTYTDHHKVLQEVVRVSEEEQTPKAVYCHLLLPHHPYIYDSAGNKSLKLNPSFKDKQAYLGQLKYTNVMLQNTLTRILAKDPNSIIVLASDHGYRQLDVEPDKTEESFGNLLAIYFPDRKYDSLYQTMTSVNVFRCVLSKILHKQYELRKDTSNYFTVTRPQTSQGNLQSPSPQPPDRAGTLK